MIFNICYFQEESPSAYDVLISSLSSCHRKKPRYDMEPQQEEVPGKGYTDDLIGEEEGSVHNQDDEASGRSDSENDKVELTENDNDIVEDVSEGESDEEPVIVCSKGTVSFNRQAHSGIDITWIIVHTALHVIFYLPSNVLRR